MRALRRLALARSLAKDLVVASLYFSGLLWLVAAARLRNRVVVLTYHRVLPYERWPNSYSSPGIIVSPRTFDWQMRFLRRHMRPLAVEQFLALLNPGARMPPRACLVTFDDGWYDTARYALPVLKRHAVPAVLYVPTDYIGTDRCFWQEHLARLLSTVRSFPEARPLVASVLQVPEPAQEIFGSKESIRRFVTELKSQPLERIEALLSALKRLAGDAPTVTEDRFLTWQEVAELDASGLVTIGSHAASHRPLTRLPAAEVRRELSASMHALSDRLGKPVATMSYPNGDATPETAAIAEEAGLQAAFTTGPGHVVAGDNRFLLSRINIQEAATRNRARFFSKILGLH
jgi:peptidoglycan/xylan/chitin deacetylase (PgdA/CDA1 family)